MPDYDVIVIGTGGVGSAAAFHLARRGKRVLGLDRFPPAHDRGSSHGHTRIIRQAYCEHPDYVPLVKRAYALWAELESRRGEQLFHRVGLLEVGPPEGMVIAGVYLSAKQHDLEVETLSAAELQKQFPGYALPEGSEAVFEPQAGYLLVEQCVLAHLEAAQEEGADLRHGLTVTGWQANGDGVTVNTDAGAFTADRLVVTAGAWSHDLLDGLGVELQVLRKPLHWFAATQDCYRPEQGGTVFLYELGERIFYGFPQIDDNGVKMAAHHGGPVVADPLNLDQQLDVAERADVADFAAQCLPGISSQQPTKHAVCMYTISPDRHFVVDVHPEFPQVSFAAGLSGHGFKFASVLGEALADLASEGETSLPIGFLGCRRDGLR